MKNWTTIVFAVALAAVVAGCGNKDQKKKLSPSSLDPNEVVIWVDGAGITQGELQADVTRLSRGIPPGLPPEQLAQLRLRVVNQAIDGVITRQLIKGAYERSGVVIPQEEVDRAKDTIFRRTEELASRLADSNLNVAQLEDNLKLDIFRNMMVKDELEAALTDITEASARKFYDENIKMFTKPAGRMASEIFVKVAPEATDEERAAAKEKAEQVRRALKEGASFAALAAEVSDAPSRQMGGQLGIVIPGQRVEFIEKAVYGQEVGELGEVLEHPDGYRVIKVTSVEDEEVLPFETVRDQILAQLRLQVQHRLGAEYVDKLREQANIRFAGGLSELNAQLEQRKAAAEAADAPEGAEAGAEAEAAPAEE